MRDRNVYAEYGTFAAPRQLGATAPAGTPTVATVPWQAQKNLALPTTVHADSWYIKQGLPVPGSPGGGYGGGSGGGSGAPGSGSPGSGFPGSGSPGATSPGGVSYPGSGSSPPGGPTGTPPGTPTYVPGASIVPQSVGTPSWPQQWQTQQAYQQQNVSVPVTVVTQPQLSNMMNPPQESGDLGPMGTMSEFLGIEGQRSQKCLTWAAIGVGLAYLYSRRSKKKAG